MEKRILTGVLEGAEEIGTIGDVSPIEYGGGLVLRRGDEAPWLEFCHGIESFDADECRTVTLEVYREEVWPDVVARLDWANLDAVSESCDTTPEEIRTRGRSAEIADRVWAIETIALYYGWHEIDSYPLSLTARELAARWNLDVPSDCEEEEEEGEDDDGIINPVLDDGYDSDLE